LNNVANAVQGTPVSEDDYRTKPFPILYERLLLEARRNRAWTETQLKVEISRQSAVIKSGAVHRSIMGLPVDEVMTTNYDQALEECLVETLYEKGSPFVREQRYSLFRHMRANDGRILWYIHGDRRAPNSILLGYDQYSGFLQQMRLYATASVQYQASQAGPIFRGKRRTQERRSWVTRFFDSDVWILGLGLDFVEIHLWWLLTHRARLRSRSVTTGNTITYVYRTGSESEAKLDLLRTLDVEPKPIAKADTDWSEYYGFAVRSINAMLPNKALQPRSRARKNDRKSQQRSGGIRG
jgi:hypothetical protein